MAEKKWKKIPRGATRASTANIIRSGGIPSRTAELCEIIWSNLLEKEDYNSLCIGLMGRGTNQGQGLR